MNTKDINVWVSDAKAYLENTIEISSVRKTNILPEQGKKFFPVIGYPPLTMFSPMDESALFEDFQARPAYPIAGYLHIPFCPTRCTFCHWITKTKSKSEEVDVYIDYLIKEMILYKQKMGVNQIKVNSVLWGG